MLQKIADKKIYFLLVALFLVICAGLLVFFPGGRSFFVINGLHHPVGDTFFVWFTYVGDGVTAGAIALLLLLFYRISAGLTMGLALGVCGLTVSLLKGFVFTESKRPTLELWDQRSAIHYVDGIYVNIEHSFPSGHSLTAFCCFTFLVLLRFGRPAGMQVLLALCAILAAYSRVYLAHHFVGDIFAGACTGIVYAFAAHLLYKKINAQQWSGRPLINLTNKTHK